MPRRPLLTPEAADDSAALHEAIQRIIDDKGRGGLSFVARETGLTASALQKRLKRPGKAFDAPTLRAAVLAMEYARSRDHSSASREPLLQPGDILEPEPTPLESVQ